MENQRRMLDLFSGTGSVSKVFKEKGWEVLTLDRDLPADIQTNILCWNFKELPVGHFDFIWASPPCTHFSVARTTAKTPRDIDGSNLLVQRALDIIDYFQPRFWCLENPATGYLKEQPVVEHLPFKDVDYCKYGFKYRKRTRIWNNLDERWKPQPLCCKASPCPFRMNRNGLHEELSQLRPRNNSDTRSARTTEGLYQIPPLLIVEISNFLV
jgi:site-specific DNA-cytosine methylase